MQLFIMDHDERLDVTDVKLVVNYWLCISAKYGYPNIGLLGNGDGSAWLHYA